MLKEGQYLRKKTELCNGVIRRHDGLETFLATDPNADMGRFDHAHIIGTVSDGQCDAVGYIVPYQQYDLNKWLSSPPSNKQIYKT
jgi:hypothetical protein